jgi:hypothetical protein
MDKANKFALLLSNYCPEHMLLINATTTDLVFAVPPRQNVIAASFLVRRRS